MPFMPSDPRQYRPTNPGQEWLNQLRSGGRITGSMPLLDATGSFTERLAAPGRRKSWQDYNARARSGSYGTPSVRGAPQPGAPRSVSSVISSLRPRSQGFMQEVAQGPPMTDRPPEQVSQNPITGRYDPLPSAAGWNAGAAAGAPQDRSDVGDGGDGGIGGYFRRPGIGAAMTAAGGAMMEAAGRPGASFGGSLGTGLQGFAAERARFQTSEAARRKAAQAGQTTPQELAAKRSVIQARLALRGIDDPMEVQRYMAMVVDQDGYEAALEELEAPEAVGPTDLKQEQEKFAWFQGLSADDKEAYNYMRRNPGTTVNIEGDQAETPVDPAQAGMNAYIRGVYNGRASTFNETIPSLQNVDQSLKLVNDPRFDKLAGVWSGNPIADVLLRYQGDPELLAMLGTFERLGSDRALAILRNFTGAKSNFEFQVSEKMAAKDRSMTPAELRAMLELMRRAYIQEAVRWAQSMVFMGEDVQIQGDYAPVQARFMSDAQGILDEYGVEERSWRQNVDPFGLGFE